MAPPIDPAAVSRTLCGDGDGGWCNLGYWSQAPGDPPDTPHTEDTPHSPDPPHSLHSPGSRYAASARALALQLAAGLVPVPGAALLEVGAGCGAALAIWREQVGAEEITALEPHPACAEPLARRAAALPRMRKLQLRRAGVDALAELPAEHFDCIVALDCAYHFQRDRFLAEAKRCLRPGGQLAMTLFTAPAIGVSTRRAASHFGVSLAPAESLATELHGAGYASMRQACWTRPVLRGFARHVLGRAPALVGRPASGAILSTAAACALAPRLGVDYTAVWAALPRP